MKNSLIIALVFLLTGMAHAQNILIVDNRVSEPSPPVYKTLAEAVDAAAAEDIIQVMPSAQSYGEITLSKQVTLIGVGFNPDKALPDVLSTVDQITLASGASSVRLSGLVVESVFYSHTLDGVLVDHCLLGRFRESKISTSDSTHSNVVISNCVFYPIQAFSEDDILSIQGATSNVTIKNNVIFVKGLSSSERWMELDGALVTNNIIAERSSVSFSASGEFNSCEVSNNIFYGDVKIQGEQTTYKNNIISSNSTDPIKDTNTGSNNLMITTPLFENFPFADDYERSFDFRLKSDSPGKNAGTDGTDIGVYGGSTPFVSTGVSLPIVRQISAPLQIPAGSNLEVEVNVRSY
jgi:hypothetical protein